MWKIQPWRIGHGPRVTYTEEMEVLGLKPLPRLHDRELVEKLSQELGYPIEDCQAIMDQMIDCIFLALARGRGVYFPNFGRWTIRHLKKRPVKNLLRGEGKFYPQTKIHFGIPRHTYHWLQRGSLSTKSFRTIVGFRNGIPTRRHVGTGFGRKLRLRHK